jgi:hypothetical protein
MSNNTTALAPWPGDKGDFPEWNPAVKFPLILCAIALVVLVGYILWFISLCIMWCVQGRRLKKKKKKLNGDDVTTDIPLEELNPITKPMSHSGGVNPYPSYMGEWVREGGSIGGDAEIAEQTPTRRRGQRGIEGMSHLPSLHKTRFGTSITRNYRSALTRKRTYSS